MRLNYCGIHFSRKMGDVLNYYICNKHFMLLEVAVHGNIQEFAGAGVTDKLEVIRVVPQEEYAFMGCSAYSIGDGNVCIHRRDEWRKHEYGYDSNDNMISHTFPNGDTVLYEYCHDNNLVTVRRNGAPLRFEYDTSNNITKIIHPSGSSMKFIYDTANNLVVKIDANGTRHSLEFATITEHES